MIPRRLRLRPGRVRRRGHRAARRARRRRQAPRRRPLAAPADEAAPGHAVGARRRRPPRRPVVRPRRRRPRRHRRAHPPPRRRDHATCWAEHVPLLRHAAGAGRRPAGPPPRHDRRLARPRRPGVRPAGGGPRARRHARRPGPDGEREIAADDFFEGFLETALAPDELLTEIRVPKVGRRRLVVPEVQPPGPGLGDRRRRRGARPTAAPASRWSTWAPIPVPPRSSRPPGGGRHRPRRPPSSPTRAPSPRPTSTPRRSTAAPGPGARAPGAEEPGSPEPVSDRAPCGRGRSAAGALRALRPTGALADWPARNWSTTRRRGHGRAARCPVRPAMRIGPTEQGDGQVDVVEDLGAQHALVDAPRCSTSSITSVWWCFISSSSSAMARPAGT